MFALEYLRSFKLFGFAIFDLSVSFLGIYLLSPVPTKLFRLIKLDISRTSWLYFTLPLSILVHIIFNTYTPMTKYFLDPNGHYLLKILIIGLIVLGIRGTNILK